MSVSKRLQDLLITTIAGMGMLLSTLDTGIINVALSFLKENFHTSASIAALTIIGYTLALAICILPLGILSDRFGKLKIVSLGFLLFGVSSLFCGLANSILWLIIWRIVQGIGAAALQATSAALITTLVSEDNKNSALSILGVMIGLGPVLGPSVGGILLSLNLWRFIFWINIPFSIIGLICVRYLFNQVREKTNAQKLDILGTFINACMLIFLLVGLSFLSNIQKLSISLCLIFLSILIGFLLYHVESKKSNALINVKGLKENSQILAYLFQTSAFGFASAMIFLLPPFIFEQIYQLDVGVTGFLVLGAPAGLVIFSRVSGKLNDGTKNNSFSQLGLVIMAISLIFLLLFNPQWNYVMLTLGLFIYGIGGGYFQPANIASIMESSPSTIQGSTGALQRMIQNVAISSGSAIGSTCLNLWDKDVLFATQIGWGITLVLVVLSLVGVIQIKRSRRVIF
ncbi:MFS transporter [Enterococcus faecium]|uniref:MDR permease n=1 Tax=Enterococcus faecium TaxID=1352 RepID=A0A242B0F1_ENTFC|nr:MFS transporter [Enterococcus faecium]OTN86717.1 MDR permease [Enterococcus faecium]OTN86758.1 MDR permease [Enterococcus faecium]